MRGVFCFWEEKNMGYITHEIAEHGNTLVAPRAEQKKTCRSKVSFGES